jgi:hypothetical protein
MLYGRGCCGPKDFIAPSGNDYRYRISSWVNKSGYTIEVFDEDGQSLWTMAPHTENSYVGNEVNDRNVAYVVRR